MNPDLVPKTLNPNQATAHLPGVCHSVNVDTQLVTCVGADHVFLCQFTCHLSGQVLIEAPFHVYVHLHTCACACAWPWSLPWMISSPCLCNDYCCFGGFSCNIIGVVGGPPGMRACHSHRLVMQTSRSICTRWHKKPVVYGQPSHSVVQMAWHANRQKDATTSGVMSAVPQNSTSYVCVVWHHWVVKPYNTIRATPSQQHRTTAVIWQHCTPTKAAHPLPSVHTDILCESCESPASHSTS